MKKSCCIASVVLALALLGVAVGATYYYYETIITNIGAIGGEKLGETQVEQLIEKCDGSNCLVKKGLGERCNYTECDATKYLSCDVISGTCHCDEKKGRIFNNMTEEGKRACVGSLGASCKENDKCINGASCLNGRCQCGQGRVKVEDNCVILGGQKCVPMKDSCAGNLKCTGPTTKDMTCSCPNPDYQSMNLAKMGCGINMGFECFPHSDESCLEGGTCAVFSKGIYQNIPTYKFKCQCENSMGFIQDGKKCGLKYGKECHEDFPCHSDLTCIAGICSCKNFWDSFDAEQGICISSRNN